MEEQNNQQNESLLKRVMNSLKVRLVDSRIFRRLPALILTGAMIASVTACDLSNLIGDGTATTTAIVTKVPATTIGPTPTTAPITTTSPTTTLPVTTSPVTDPVVPPQPGEEGFTYSQLLQNVINDDYYNGLILMYYADHLTSSQLNYIIPHPYGFLEDEGFDTYKIKNGEYECFTETFVKDEEPNNIYMATRVENPEGYYTEYMLRYTLTDEEMRDYQMLYNLPSNNKGKNCAVQMAFINDQISKEKEPVVLCECNVDMDTHKDFRKNNKKIKAIINNRFNFDEFNYHDVIFHSYDAETGQINFYLFNHSGITSAQDVPADFAYVQLQNPTGIKAENGYLIGEYNDTLTIKSELGTATNYRCDFALKDRCADLASADFEFH